MAINQQGFIDGLDNPVRQRGAAGFGIVCGGVEHGQELVASQADRKLSSTYAGTDSSRCLLQEQIADLMAVLVVDQLEAVQIHVEKGQNLAAAGSGDRVVQIRIQRAAVGKSRKLVLMSLIFHLIERKLGLRQVRDQVMEGFRQNFNVADAFMDRNRRMLAPEQALGGNRNPFQRASGHAGGEPPRYREHEGGQYPDPNNEMPDIIYGSVGDVDRLPDDDGPSKSLVVLMPVSKRVPRQIGFAVAPAFLRIAVLAGLSFRQAVQHQRLAHHGGGADENRIVVSADNQNIYFFFMFLQGMQNRGFDLAGPGPAEMSRQHPLNVQGLVVDRQADVDKLHRLSGRIGKKLAQQDRLMDVSDELPFYPFLKNRTLSDVAARQNPVGGCDDRSLRVQIAYPGK
ncbi:hypothetical protein BN871_BM_00300 [Paenibacillus sp. P22]|nr:hypothetical protein BN871_BM_00300 [Paenibacillus sp. P22]